MTGARFLPPAEAASITPRVIPPKPLGVLVSSASVHTSVRAGHTASQTINDAVSSCHAQRMGVHHSHDVAASKP